MALSITVTKVSATQLDGGLYSITAHLNCKNGSAAVIDRDFSVTYNTASPVSVPQAELKALMQAEIDRFKAGQVVFNAAALDSALSTIQTQLVG